jgi:hypothetical protein
VCQIDNSLDIIFAMKEDMAAVNPDMSFWARRMMFVRYCCLFEGCGLTKWAGHLA